MLKIDCLRIRNFRGIRDLCINPGGDNLVILGPNGSGKSSVVDALDFALTGDVSRFRGTGLGRVTLQRHGPHVQHQGEPGAAIVELTFTDTNSNKSAVLKRSIAFQDPVKPEIELPEVKKVMADASKLSKLILSRREIARYILSPPQMRSDEIRALLGFERLDAVRTVLRKAQSTTESVRKNAAEQVTAAEDSLMRHCDLSDFSTEGVRAAVNQRRLVLGLRELPVLDSGGDFSSDVIVNMDGLEPFNKSSAIADVESARGCIGDRFGVITRALSTLQLQIYKCEAHEGFDETLESRFLVQSGLDLLGGLECPLCDRKWPGPETLDDYLRRKLQRSDTAATLKKAQTKAADTVKEAAQAIVRNVVDPLIQVARAATVDTETQDSLDFARRTLCAVTRSVASATTVAEAIEFGDKVSDTREILVDAEAEVRSAVGAKPDLSEVADAYTFLKIAQQRWLLLHHLKSDARSAKAADYAAEAANDSYHAALQSGLTRVYATIRWRFIRLYRYLNQADEGNFNAELRPNGQNLNFSVDFYGSEGVSPAAYHSEGHQDAMGICLYLALMEESPDKSFRLAILDDVVTSVDVGHRKRLCEMLATKFQHVQFIITTHDRAWANQMIDSGLVNKEQQVRLFRWNVIDGPSMESADDWERIADHLKDDDVNAAAARLRQHIERTLTKVAERIHAKVPCREDGHWNRGELLDAVKHRYNEFLDKAWNTAHSANDARARERVEIARDAWNETIKNYRRNDKIVNPAVHDSQGRETSSPEELKSAVESSFRLFEIFRCSDCGALLRLPVRYTSPDLLSCSCKSG